LGITAGLSTIKCIDDNYVYRKGRYHYFVGYFIGKPRNCIIAIPKKILHFLKKQVYEIHCILVLEAGHHFSKQLVRTGHGVVV